MHYYGQAEAVAGRIINAFQTGTLPAPLAQVFIRRTDNRPQNSWSIANQIAVILFGCSDARGFKQWLEVGRCVKKGETAHAWILVPLQKKAEDRDNDPGYYIYGYKTAAVFDISQTEGDPVAESEMQQWVDALPLVNVARAWELDVLTYSGGPGHPLGRYTHGRNIALGVENLSTWAHELIHAADWRLGNLVETGNHWLSETVAELGGATLLTMLGRPTAADAGGAWEYIRVYAAEAKKNPVDACFLALNRITQAISLIMTVAEAQTPVDIGVRGLE